MVCETWSDDPVYDQKKRKKICPESKQEPMIPTSDQSKCLVLSTGVGQTWAHKSDLFQVWQSCQVSKDQISEKSHEPDAD